MHDGIDPATVIFALIAIFVVWKLRSILGSRVDIERRPPPPSPANGSAARRDDNVVRLPGAADRPEGARPERSRGQFEGVAKSEKARAGLAAIASADPQFDAARFLGGAKVAYEMIIGAFAHGDRKTLGNLLSPEVLASFTSVIDQREKSGEQASSRLVSIDSTEIVDAGIKDGVAQVSARISAKLINTVHDQTGALVSGDPDTVVSTDDLWTFSRVVRSPDPTWRLIATDTGHSA